ncbi:DUF6241 domain-containing protein [Sporosarcina psychrophila]|uniref:DUF6241 domain-containing protein n=1 Tax=Sporosarcina psychrophila TaxID=1476 RepID=UPI00078EC8FD|nr:DUF6241 domain-containing protein [Sporosarcina psychrophila]AMQ06714.1 hypothetical protein AZE41_12660 [Sporosarcina psychrophila]
MKVAHVLGITFLTAVISIGGTYFYTERVHNNELLTVNSSSENERQSSEMTDETSDKKEFISTVDTSGGGWEDVTHSNWIDEWKSGVKSLSESVIEPLSESLMQEFIQEMAHQKIIADEKEGSIMITPERIDTLKQLVEENKGKYEHADAYLEVLNRWGNGDFSMVDYDHNLVMYLQHSKLSDGIAKGIASKEQEIHYIFHVFAKEVDDVLGSDEKK